MTEALDALANRWADREFVRWATDGSSTNYAELADLAARWGTLLSDAGVVAGDRVVLLQGNTPSFLGAHFGAQWIGAISVPLNSELRGASLRHLLHLYRPRAVVADSDLVRVVSEAGPDASVAVISADTDALASAHPGHRRPHRESDPCLIMSTSGTTGPSKGSVWTYATVEQWARGYVRHLHYTEADRIYSCTPLFHANSLIAAVATAQECGGAVVLGRRFSVSRFWDEVASSGATSANLLGSMIDLLLNDETIARANDRRRNRLRTMLASSVSASAHRLVEERWGLSPVTAYGLTDFGTVLSTTEGDRAPAGTVGRPVQEFEIRLVDDDDHDVPTGEAGEAVLRSRIPWIAPNEYFGMPEESLRARRNLWFHTGDLLRLDEEGWYYFVGRAKDSMRRRGENVSAFEVEAVAVSHEAVSEAAAYAVPGDGSEDEIAVAVVPQAGAAHLDLPDLISHMARELPYFAVPRYVRVVASLPHTATHKVQKEALRHEGVTLDMWDRTAEGIEVARNQPR